MKVYRLQNVNGKGPYSKTYHIDAIRSITDKHNEDLINHPTPNIDKYPMTVYNFNLLLKKFNGYISVSLTKNIYFGFKDLETFERWFPKHEQVVLKEYGYTLCAFKISKKNLFDTGRQVMFYSRRKLTKELDLLAV